MPPDQTLSHDGSETVHGLWTRPQEVIDAADRDRKYSLYFATRLNLMDLAQSGTVAEALARAAGRVPPQAMPWRELTADGPRLRIDPGFRLCPGAGHPGGCRRHRALAELTSGPILELL